MMSIINAIKAIAISPCYYLMIIRNYCNKDKTLNYCIKSILST